MELVRLCKQFYIDGDWVDPVDPHPFKIIDPATETMIAEVLLVGRADIDRAISAASAAFSSWAEIYFLHRID